MLSIYLNIYHFAGNSAEFKIKKIAILVSSLQMECHRKVKLFLCETLLKLLMLFWTHCIVCLWKYVLFICVKIVAVRLISSLISLCKWMPHRLKSGGYRTAHYKTVTKGYMLQNGTYYKRYALHNCRQYKMFSYKTVCVTKRYVLQNGTCY
jgi:hypothetical protein